MASSIPKAIPSAIAPSAKNSVRILTEPQLGPHKPMSGKSINPVVPRSDDQAEKDLTPQPGYGTTGTVGAQPDGGGNGAPTVPVDGFLFKLGPIDSHYISEVEAKDPYGKVNNPPTRGMKTFVKEYPNHIAGTSQFVDPNGFRISEPQQRTSVMRFAPPPEGIGYAPEIFTPKQLPQRDNTYKFNPSTGTQKYGTGVLNSDTFGAGQTAGGIGGNQYTPSPGPPDTTSTAGKDSAGTDMPTWG